MPVSALPDVLLATIVRLPQFTVSDLQANGATVSTSLSAFSWGGRITVQFGPTGDATSAVDARLAPLLPTNVLDFGQSKKDLTLFLQTFAAVAAL